MSFCMFSNVEAGEGHLQIVQVQREDRLESLLLAMMELNHTETLCIYFKYLSDSKQIFPSALNKLRQLCYEEFDLALLKALYCS